MNAVVYYSNTGQSQAVAEYFASKLSFNIINIEKVSEDTFENLVLVFPVLCQNVPDTVKCFLKKVKIENLSIIATYGKMYHGNVLYEIQKRCNNVIAGAYIPTKHSYIVGDETFQNYDALSVVVEKIKNPSRIHFPRLYKNPLANLFPKLRSRMGLKINKTDRCNGCSVCEVNCSFSAIKKGVTNNRCIRCLKCVSVCPNKALNVRVGLPLKLYLKKKKIDKLIVYV